LDGAIVEKSWGSRRIVLTLDKEKAQEYLAFMRRLLELMEESCFYLSFYKDCEKEKGGEESGGGGV
jgi:hypothetical protein